MSSSSARTKALSDRFGRSGGCGHWVRAVHGIILHHCVGSPTNLIYTTVPLYSTSRKQTILKTGQLRVRKPSSVVDVGAIDDAVLKWAQRQDPMHYFFVHHPNPKDVNYLIHTCHTVIHL